MPFCAIYSTFLQRGYDQVVHDVALQKLPGGALFLLISSSYGASHAGGLHGTP